MTPAEYLKIEDAETALAVRLAVTMGWQPEKTSFIRSWCGNYVEVKQKIDDRVHYHTFDPFTDASIPFGLPVDLCFCEMWLACCGSCSYTSKSKTHAIINAYCQADPMGHWKTFIGENNG